MDYQTSVKFALYLGYKEVQDPQAFQGRYFIKDGKKWIHDIEALIIIRVRFQFFIFNDILTPIFPMPKEYDFSKGKRVVL